MGLIKTVATLGAAAAAGVLVANREKVIKVVQSALARPAARSSKALAAKSAAPAKVAGKVKRAPNAKAPRAARRKARRVHRHVAAS
ncbi:MAG: hypothetical protein ABI467_23735 [Kofleriaceae bacterium]